MEAKVVMGRPRRQGKEIILSEKVFLQIQENRLELQRRELEEERKQDLKNKDLLEINAKWRIKACKVLGQDRVVEIMCKQLTNNFKEPSTKLDNTSLLSSTEKNNIEIN